MADFDLAIPFILLNEGGFVDNPNDPGEATKFGISLKFMKLIPEFSDATESDIKNLTEDKAKAIYHDEFWVRYDYGKINDQVVATKIFDMSVNVGVSHSHIIVQRAIRSALGWLLTEDGTLGVKSLSLLNMAQRCIIMPAIKSEAAGYYRSIKYPGSEKFITGWLNRAYLDPKIAGYV